MKSMQDRMMQQIESQLLTLGYSVAVQHHYANTGHVYAFTDDVNHTIPTADIGFDFQSDTYQLRLTVNGRKIPSQVGRADYFDFYQKYTEPTRFWAELKSHLPALKKKKRALPKVDDQDHDINVERVLNSTFFNKLLDSYSVSDILGALSAYCTQQSDANINDGVCRDEWSGKADAIDVALASL